jgi:hypothetical protein
LRLRTKGSAVNGRLRSIVIMALPSLYLEPCRRAAGTLFL